MEDSGKQSYDEIYGLNTCCDYSYGCERHFIGLSERTFNETTSNFLSMLSANRDKILDGYTDDEIYALHKQIVPIDKVKKDILTYEFVYCDQNSKGLLYDTIDDVLTLLKTELDTYQWIVGGFNIDDKEWLECSDSSRFKPKDTQRAIYNSFESRYDDFELRWFIKTIIQRVNNCIDQSKNKIYYKIIEDASHEITWLIFVVESI